MARVSLMRPLALNATVPIDWFNHRRLLEPIGHVPPAEFEDAYHRKEVPSYTPGLKEPSLR